MDYSEGYHNDDSCGSTYSNDSYPITPILTPKAARQHRDQISNKEGLDSFSQYGCDNEWTSNSKALPNFTNAKLQRKTNQSPRGDKNSFPFSTMEGTEGQRRTKKSSNGHLTPKIVMSGVSRLALPSMKDKKEKDFQLGTVLVLHLQCRNITVLTLGALDPFFSLKNLYLYKNNIRRIQGLDYLHNLELLDLSRNNVERIDNLQKCQKLKKLYLGFNEIQVVEGLEGLNVLEELQVDDQDIPPEQPLIFSPGIMDSVTDSLLILDISSNQLSTLGPISNMRTLHSLNAADNCLKDIKEVLTVLQTLPQLQNLQLKGNPIAKKPNYKSSIIGSVYRLEVLDDKDIHDATRLCVQKLKLLKEVRTRQGKDKADFKAKGINQQQHQQRTMDFGTSSDFNFATPTRLSPSPFPPPPKPFKLTRKALSASNASKVDSVKKPTGSVSEPSFKPTRVSSYSMHTTTVMDSNGRLYESKSRNLSIQESEFKDDFKLDHDDEGMSDMAKIIFRLSNLDDLGAEHGGSGDAKVYPSNYWDLPGSSLVKECRPISPLEGLDLALSPPLRSSMSCSEPTRASYYGESKSSGNSRPKPAAPGGRRSSNNVTGSASAPNYAYLTEDIPSQQNQNYIYGRTLSPLIELPTPESLTARDENK